MVDLILAHSDHIVAAMFVLIAGAMLLARPKVSCCRQPRWERHRPEHRRRS
ncbi:MAG TPA: hypothetical protein PKD53_00135 [Chloroflexaceae bacterium]|nr:hypothetical protein [Chloroflexaceae bacterium]